MNLLSQVSSALGEKTKIGNHKVAQQCLANPELIQEMILGLRSEDNELVGDCTEVLTKIAEVNPTLVSDYLEDFILLLSKKKTRVRWEAMHAISLVAGIRAQDLQKHFSILKSCIENESSTIVRDYAIDSFIHYALSGEEQAQEALPFLTETLPLFDGKHRGRILRGLKQILQNIPALSSQILDVAMKYIDDEKPTIKKVAQIIVNKARKNEG